MDLDFGWLVFVSHLESAGVILVRYPGNLRSQLAESIMQLVREEGDKLHNAFVVVQPGHVRITQKPKI